MSTFALIPARHGSKGIPYKNYKRLGDKSLIQHAVDCAKAAGIELVRVSTDIPHLARRCDVIWRPESLAQDDTPMIDVVKHALEQIPGPDDQIIVLLQPTQPFRTPEHVKQAIQLLQEFKATTSVVSVVEIATSCHPENAMYVYRPSKREVLRRCAEDAGLLTFLPTRRQDLAPAYRRDGTVYAFYRRTVKGGDIYGSDPRPLIIPPEESCELDTIEQWHEVERRWAARAASQKS